VRRAYWEMVGEFSHHKALYFGGVLRRNFQYTLKPQEKPGSNRLIPEIARAGGFSQLKNDGVSESQLG